MKNNSFLSVDGLNVAFDTPNTTNTDLEEVVQIIKSAISLGGNHFPFNPGRGIDLDKYLFEYQDEINIELQKKFLQDNIKALDERITEVVVGVEVLDKHITGIDILVFVNNEHDTITYRF